VNLPVLESSIVPDLELAIALYCAARVLESEGRRALGACVFGAGSRMTLTADALGRAADALLTSTPDARAGDHRAFVEACESLITLAGFLWWERSRLEGYCAALRGPSRLNGGAIAAAGGRGGQQTSEDIND
jgi:hypothetical protein